jgi:hypothetical protein
MADLLKLEVSIDGARAAYLTVEGKHIVDLFLFHLLLSIFPNLLHSVQMRELSLDPFDQLFNIIVFFRV